MRVSPISACTPRTYRHSTSSLMRGDWGGDDPCLEVKPAAPRLPVVWFAVVTMMILVCIGPDPSVIVHPAHAQNATGTPINFGSIGDYRTTTQLGALLNAAAFGMNLSFGINNNLRNGVKGRPVQLNVRYTDNDQNAVPALMDDLMANVPELIGMAHAAGDLHIEKTIDYIDALPENQKMVLVQPSAGVRKWFEFSKSYTNAIPPVDAELYAGIRHLAYRHQFTRFAIVTDVYYDFGTELVPDIRRLISGLGANLTYYYKLNYATSPDTGDVYALQGMIATNPHAVLLLGGLFPNTAAALISILVALPNTYVWSIVGIMPLVDAALRQLPFNGLIKDRILSTNVGPLYSDPTSTTVVKRFRSEVLTAHNSIFNLTSMDASPPVGTFAFLGWLMGEVILSALRRLDTDFNATSFRDSIFENSIYTVEDFVLGPYSGECTGSRTLYCRCNNGARVISIVQFTDAFTLKSTNDDFSLPLSSCTAANLSLPSPVAAALVYPVEGDDDLAIDFKVGRDASSLEGDIVTDGVVVEYIYISNSTAALQTLNTEKLITASAGSVLNTPIGDATGIGAVIDPMEVRPRLYGGFRRDVVYVSPTYEQELHAFASLAVAQGKGITVLSALDDDGSAVGSTLTRSMNTLGQEGGGHRSSASIASGLLATGDGGVTILHGIATSADIAAIATHLGQRSNAVVAIPMAHLLVWYRKLVATVTDEGQRSRIVFATSLPNWAGPVSGETTGPALQTYFDRVPATNRTPATLRGFMTHQLLTYVTGRIPNQKTPTEFLRMLYGASVIVMDTGLVAGPYFDAVCLSDTSSSTCEMNIGARLIRVRSLSASITLANGSASGADSSSITFDSGRISYTGLPTTDNSLRNIIIIVAVVGGLLLMLGAVGIILACLCSGRSNWTAPKDEKEPFTIIFTDIQSSTNLWAEAPEAMAPALDHHHALIRKLCSKHHGYEVKTIGDAFMIAFKDAIDAVNLSSALQFDFYNDKTWSQQIDQAYLEMDQVRTSENKAPEKHLYSISLPPEDYDRVWNGLRVRIGIHTGFGEIKKDPVSHGYDYYGTVVNTAARTEAIAHGGQVIMTEAALAASGISEDRVVPMGAVMLRGVPDPVRIFQLTTIANRVFPSHKGTTTGTTTAARDDVGGATIVESGGDQPGFNGKTSERQCRFSFSQSTTRSFPVRREVQESIHRQVLAVLKTLLSVHPAGPRGRILIDTCRRWQLDVPSSEEDKTAFVTSPDALDKLCSKIAPIMARRKEFGLVGRGGSVMSTSSASDSKAFDNINPFIPPSPGTKILEHDESVSNKDDPYVPTSTFTLFQPSRVNADESAVNVTEEGSGRGGGGGGLSVTVDNFHTHHSSSNNVGSFPNPLTTTTTQMTTHATTTSSTSFSVFSPTAIPYNGVCVSLVDDENSGGGGAGADVERISIQPFIPLRPAESEGEGGTEHSDGNINQNQSAVRQLDGVADGCAFYSPPTPSENEAESTPNRPLSRAL